MGVPSSGTRVATGTLFRNDWYVHEPYTTTYECEEAYDCLAGRYREKTAWGLPDFGPSKTAKQIAQGMFRRYRQWAHEAGMQKCFMKANWMPLWCPELFEGVDVLLIGRDPFDNAKSMRDKLPELTEGEPEEETLERCQRAQEQIRLLSREYGWPIWQFGKDASHEALEEAIGEKLEAVVLNTEQIENS